MLSFAEIESLRQLTSGIYRMYLLEQEYNKNSFVCEQYKHKKEELFDDWVLSIVQMDMDLLEAIALVSKGQKAFAIRIDTSFWDYLASLYHKLKKEENNSPPLVALERFMARLMRLTNTISNIQKPKDSFWSNFESEQYNDDIYSLVGLLK